MRTAAVAQYAETRPQTAARVWPSHPASQLWLGLTQIGLSARNRTAVDPDTLALIRSAAAKAPLEAEPFLVRGVQAQLSGDHDVAEQAFLAAKLRDGRSIPARYFLAEHYFRRANPERGLREIAVLARMVPNGVANLAPFVAAYAKDPRNRTQLKALFRSDPLLEQAALSTLASDPRNADLVLELATPTASPDWAVRLLHSLVTAGRYGEAYRVWARVARIERPAGQLVFDPGFAGSPAPPPFNWTLASSTVGLAERQPGGRLHVIFYGQEDGVLASQLLLLEPGRYRLAMRVAGDVTRAQSLTWTVTCAKARSPLAALRLGDAARAAAGVVFEVPVGCAAQALELSGSAAELPQEADVTISALSLTRVSGNG